MKKRDFLSALLIAVGLGFIAVPYTSDFAAQSRQERIGREVVEAWQSGQKVATPSVLKIPRFGSDWTRVIREGTTDDALDDGIGHYTFTDNPGDTGNYALAGHRSGNGSALLDIEKVVNGDSLIVETASKVYLYKVACHVVVSPSEDGVLRKVPGYACAKSADQWLTLTTCSPKYGNTERYIVFARLTSVKEK